MIKHYIIIKTKTRNKDKLLVKFYKNRINVYDIFTDHDELYLKILENDLKNVQNKIVTQKFQYVTDSGIYHLKNTLTPLKILAIVLFIFLVNALSQIIVNVDVIHSNKEIRELVRSSLEDYGIKKYTFRKNYEDLTEIKEKILDTYKDKLEWLEIERVGMKYIVRIEERIINNVEQEEKFCHIVASKSGIISSIHSTKGEIVVEKGKYVQEGELLISGEIKLFDEVKNNVCASGNVLAEVWYTTSVKLPINYQKTKRTGKWRFNFLVETAKGKYKILKSRLKSYESENKKLFTLFDINFYVVREYEVSVENLKYDLESGVQKATHLADQKINMQLKDDETVKSRKVLKKNLNDSTIEVELFYVVNENITKVEEYTIEEMEEEVR